jgi:hypothetical protein
MNKYGQNSPTGFGAMATIPSIVIWDAINENWNDYIGNTLIPELQQLDPTRIWDAGYMQETDLAGS